MRIVFDQGSRIVLISLVCLTVGKTAYYGIERAVAPHRPEPPRITIRLREAPPAVREALADPADRKSDRLR